MKKPFLVKVTPVFALIAGLLLPLDLAAAESSTKLTTCINLTTAKERVSQTGLCLPTKEAQANWHVLQSDSNSPREGKSKTITVCSSKPNSLSSYQIIRPRCGAYQVRTDYFRSTVVNPAPSIVSVSAMSSNVVRVSLNKDYVGNPDAPVAYYTLTTNTGESKRIYAQNGLNLSFNNLAELTSYSFTVTATTADGTSPVSANSDEVTTPKFIAPTTSVIQPVAQVNLLSDDTAAVTVPIGATSVAVVAPTLGNPSISFGSQGAAITATISTAANPVGGSSTPFTVSGSTKIVDINVSGLTGSATVCLDASPTAKLWHYVSGAWVDITTSRTSTQVCGLTSSFSPFAAEEQLAAPAFTLSVSSVTVNQDSAITTVTATKTAHAQSVTYSISPTLPSGLSINSSTGTISGTPTTTSSPTDYVITATNVAAGTATQTLSITVNAALTCAQGGACNVGGVGPGGGIIAYYSAAGFTCGRDYNLTCHYLEAAPSNWDSALTKLCPDPTGDNWSVKYTQSAIGRGYYNSYQMYTTQAHCRTWSMKEAFDYRGTGATPLSDWFIPSSGELHAVLSFLFSDAQILVTGISRSGKNFWSSTQLSAGTSVIESDGLVTGAQWAKNSYYTIPIRAF
jgi:hypothetical protein